MKRNIILSILSILLIIFLLSFAFVACDKPPIDEEPSNDIDYRDYEIILERKGYNVHVLTDNSLEDPNLEWELNAVNRYDMLVIQKFKDIKLLNESYNKLKERFENEKQLEVEKIDRLLLFGTTQAISDVK